MLMARALNQNDQLYASNQSNTNQSNMDIAFFSEMLETLNTKSDTIHNVVQYCWLNKTSAEEITKMVQKDLIQARKDKKIAYFYVLNDLLVNSAASGDLSYIKAIGTRIKAMIADFIKGNDNVTDLGSLVKLVEKWHSDQIFASSFTAKLKDIITPTYLKLLEAAEQDRPEKEVMKYSKTFMVDYMTVQEFEPAKNLYSDSVAWADISSKINKFNQEYNKLDLNNASPEVRERGEELIRVGEEYKNQLIKLIEGFHVHYKLLSDRCREEIKSNILEKKPSQEG